MNYEQLKLENQICFPVYAASRLIIKQYQPHLDKLGITYPQYLVLMVLWEEDGLPVNDIAKKLILNTNTVTPLLKRMESLKILKRERSLEDERKVMVKLTEKGISMKDAAAKIPLELIESLQGSNIELSELIDLKDKLNKVLELLTQK